MRVGYLRFWEMMHLLKYASQKEMSYGHYIYSNFRALDKDKPLSYVEAAKALRLLLEFDPYRNKQKKAYFRIVNRFIEKNRDFIDSVIALGVNDIPAAELRAAKQICIANKLGNIPKTPSDKLEEAKTVDLTAKAGKSSPKRSKKPKDVESKEAKQFVTDCDEVGSF